MNETSFRDMLASLWNFQLFVVDTSPITLGKVIIGLFLVVMGYFVAKVGSRAIGRRVIARLQVDNAMKFTLEKILFYVLYVFVVLFVLQLLSIPVTVFTLVGGVLAIGIGFGSQNIVSNFISGLIMMAEQPMRVGDWVEIEGVFGQVSEIGSRSTMLTTSDNREVIVPNSFFLEKMFTNWTLSDTQVGGKLNIGVAYGTDPKLVRSLLIQAASEHPAILKSPVPGVTFTDFADSSLNFSLGFSIRFDGVTTVGSVSSDLRFRIDELFSEKKISIPFPHREILLNTMEPLRVHVDQSRADQPGGRI